MAVSSRVVQSSPWLPNFLATTYAVIGYASGWVLLLSGGWLIQALGVLILAHSMVISAYLIHEAVHNCVFENLKSNLKFAGALNWLTGTAYNSALDIREKHLRHHFDVADVVAFDPYRYMSTHPGWVRVLRFFEWFYIPLAEIWMHGMMIAVPFLYSEKRSARWRVFLTVIIRGVFFLGLLVWRPDAAVGYMMAYCIFLQILRFMDAFQHDYSAIETLYTKAASGLKGNRKYEEAHTFSNPISTRRSWPNWLVLNFGFHNAHHAKPFLGWYQLGEFHSQRYTDTEAPVSALRSQVRCFHRNRSRRVYYEDDESDDFLERIRQGRALGGNSASFLTAF